MGFILCYILEIELIEMGKPTVPASDSKIPASDKYFVGAFYVAVPAISDMCKVPGIIAINFNEVSGTGNIFNTGDKNTDCPAVIANNLSLIRDCMNDLVCHLFAMVAISIECHGNELVGHEKYWICPGSLICCKIYPEKM